MSASVSVRIGIGQQHPIRRSLRRFLKRRGAVIGLIVVLLFILTAVLAPLLSPYDPTATNFAALMHPPSPSHLMGTDTLGRDTFSRIIWGARSSLIAGVISVALAMGVGIPLGLVAGFFQGWLDEIIMRLTDALMAFPFLVLAIALAAALGPNLINAMVAIGIATMPVFVRLTRGQVLSITAEDYVQAARGLGASNQRLMFIHIFPNVFSPLLVQGTLQIATAIIAEAILSYLGLGQQPPTPSWGGMLNTAQSYMAQDPFLAVWPGIMIFIVVLAFNLFGDGLRDALDPRKA